MKLLYLLPFILFGCTKKSPFSGPSIEIPEMYIIAVYTDVCPSGNTVYHDVAKEEYDKVYDQLTGEDCDIVEFYSMTDNATVSGWFLSSYAPN